MKPIYSSLFAVLTLMLNGCRDDVNLYTVNNDNVHTVKNVSVNLGNIMYCRDEEEGMFDLWYDAVELQRGRSTAFVTNRDHFSENEVIRKLQPGDQVEILTDLTSVRKMELGAYWADDLEIRIVD